MAVDSCERLQTPPSGKQSEKSRNEKHLPNPATLFPIAGYENEIYVKPAVKNPQIVVGDFTYIADSDFEKHVSHLYEWNGDRLIMRERLCRSRTEFALQTRKSRSCYPKAF